VTNVVSVSGEGLFAIAIFVFCLWRKQKKKPERFNSAPVI
jgi:hypothetical protein